MNKEMDHCEWRPIASMHHPEHMEVIHALDEDRDAFGWTHFAPVPSLTHEEAARLRAEMGK
jgi:hypothetical protein